MQRSLDVLVDTIGFEGREVAVELAEAEANAELAARNCSGVKIAGPLRAHFDLAGDPDEVHVDGSLKVQIESDCVRCLDSFRAQVEGSFKLRLVRGKSGVRMDQETELELESSDLEIETFEGDSIDLGEILFEQLMLVLPDHPLCRMDCRGLCPVCGAELNTKDCGCADNKPVDPRLAVLSRLKGRNR